MRTDGQVNSAAISYGTAPQPTAPTAEGGYPCIQVAGVTVYLYRRQGRVVVSVDTDDVNDDTPVYSFGGENLVAITVRCNGDVVWEGAPTEDDLRAIRKVGG